MEVLYTGHIHGFPKDESLSHTATPSSSSSLTVWDAQSGLVALAVVLTTSISLVGLAFAFLTYRFVLSPLMNWKTSFISKW